MTNILPKRSITPKAAKRRYLVAVLGTTGAYLAALFGVVGVLNSSPDLAPWQQLALVALPAIPVLMTLYAIWRYLGEMDEVQRRATERSMLAGAFAVLAVAGSVGLADLMVESLPDVSIFWAFPVFFLSMAVAGMVFKAPC